MGRAAPDADLDEAVGAHLVDLDPVAFADLRPELVGAVERLIDFVADAD